MLADEKFCPHCEGWFQMSSNAILNYHESFKCRNEKIELNKIYKMNCLDGMKKMPAKSVDMILCDLPYGTTRNNWDSVIPLTELWLQYERIIKDNGAIVLTAQQPFTSILVASNPTLFRYEWIWEKTNATGHLNAKRMPLKAHENVLVFYKKLPTYNPIKTVGHKRKTSNAKKENNKHSTSNYGGFEKVNYDSTERYPRSVMTFSMDKQKSALHPTQKPLGLFEYLVKTYSNEGDVVLDNCIGSGTTAIACMNTNRHFIGFELNEKYYEIAIGRIEKTKS